MKKYRSHFVTALFVFIFSGTSLIGQEICGSHTNYPDLEEGYTNSNQFALKSMPQDVYEINVVFHVVYNTTSENLHDSIIHNQMEILKNDFRRMNADTVNMRSQFSSIVGDSKIQLNLATLDPNGNATNGITRTQTSVDYFDLTVPSEAEKVKKNSEGGKDPWDSDKYLNIWICNGSEFANPTTFGYSSPNTPVLGWQSADLTELDGVVLVYQAVGSNNPNTISNSFGMPRTVKGRIATHEVGHYFGLMHIFEDGCNNEGDWIEDTPKTPDVPLVENCDDMANGCVDAIGSLGDLPDMYENFMDYSGESCQNSFTKGQIEVMRNLIINHRPGLLQPGVGIGESNPVFDIYFNPSTNMGQINSEKLLMTRVTVFDLLGRTVQSHTLKSKTFTIANLSEGIFMVEVEFENRKKIIKKIIM
ncbi:MAG: zinc-dependent metalloprotease [Flavobacteriales bacterium]